MYIHLNPGIKLLGLYYRNKSNNKEEFVYYKMVYNDKLENWDHLKACLHGKIVKVQELELIHTKDDFFFNLSQCGGSNSGPPTLYR